MELKQLPQILLGIILTPIITLAFHQSSYAEERFKCNDKLQNPITLAKTSRRWRPMLLWESNYFRTSKKERCRTVSNRLQRYHDNRMIAYLRSGKFNGYPVICIVDRVRGKCLKEDVVVTLQPGTDVGYVLTQIKYFRTGASESQPVRLSSSELAFYEDGDFYLNLNEIIEK